MYRPARNLIQLRTRDGCRLQEPSSINLIGE
jgi:hypothetical protein